jgi:D-alanyl-D-alanine carboxypeptidase/D-alanyl-D-alanine-endopeptidase (penicillin-binding protein 4)
MQILKLTFIATLFLNGNAFAISTDELQKRLDSHIQNLPGKSTVAIHAEVLGSGALAASKNPLQKMSPASVSKLIPAYMGLETFGAQGVVNTRVFAEGKLQAGILQGDLVIEGEGDPFLVSERLWLLARDVARSGVKEVSGGLKISNRAFNGDYLDLTKWTKSGSPFAAAVSATSVNFNSVEVHVRPDTSGTKILVEVGPVPTDYIVVKNQAKLRPGKVIELDLTNAGTQSGKEVFILSGSVGTEANKKIEYASVMQPSAYFAHVFANMLRQEGVKIQSTYSGLYKGEPKGKLLASLESLPMAELIKLFNTYSNNFMAEQTFIMSASKITGQPGSVELARNQALSFLEKRNICNGIKLENGSGLSWQNAIDPKCLVDIFQSAYREGRAFPALWASLPVGGQTGTLKNRFKNLGSGFDPRRVFAKTGTIWSEKTVSSLAGITQARSGQWIVFAIILNDPRSVPSQLATMRDWEDKCVELLQQLQY